MGCRRMYQTRRRMGKPVLSNGTRLPRPRRASPRGPSWPAPSKRGGAPVWPGRGMGVGKLAKWAVAAALCAACSQGHTEGPPPPPPVDDGGSPNIGPDAGPPDAGPTLDGGVPDAGGTPDAGGDAGTPPDGGTDGGT